MSSSSSAMVVLVVGPDVVGKILWSCGADSSVGFCPAHVFCFRFRRFFGSFVRFLLQVAVSFFSACNPHSTFCRESFEAFFFYSLLLPAYSPFLFMPAHCCRCWYVFYSSLAAVTLQFSESLIERVQMEFSQPEASKQTHRFEARIRTGSREM